MQLRRGLPIDFETQSGLRRRNCVSVTVVWDMRWDTGQQHFENKGLISDVTLRYRQVRTRNQPSETARISLLSALVWRCNGAHGALGSRPFGLGVRELDPVKG